MCLAVNDKVLEEMRMITHKSCDRIIEKYNAMPWWKRWFHHKECQDAIRETWAICEKHQEQRIKEMRAKE